MIETLGELLVVIGNHGRSGGKGGLDKPNASREARVGVEIRNALAFKLYGNATGTTPTHRLVLRFNDNRTSLLTDINTGLPPFILIG